MKDIPIFTTEYGVASLALKEIPYRQEAYVRVQDAQPGEIHALAGECIGFCRAAGAERIYATGHTGLEGWPEHCRVLEMRGAAWVDPEKMESLFPVTEQTVSRWRQVFNERMARVDNAATMEKQDEAAILNSNGAYFIHREGSLLGIGWLEDGTLRAVAAAERGAGERVMHTLMSVAEGELLRLEVASTNKRAIRLYERLGFLATGEISRWYRIF